jgi:hypothetical protein
MIRHSKQQHRALSAYLAQTRGRQWHEMATAQPPKQAVGYVLHQKDSNSPHLLRLVNRDMQLSMRHNGDQ